MVCWKFVLPAFLVFAFSTIVVGRQADTSKRNGSNKKSKTVSGIYFLRNLSNRDNQKILPEIVPSSLNLRIKKKHDIRNTNEFVRRNKLCQQDSRCKRLEVYFKQRKRKPLRLRSQRTTETKGATRSFIILQGKQISREYIRKHHGFKPVLRALKKRLETLKARKKAGLTSLSPRNTTADDIAVLRDVKKFPSLFLVRSASRDAESGKKQDVQSYGETEATEVRTSSPEDIRHWDILGTLHTYEGAEKNVSKPRHEQKLPDPLKDDEYKADLHKEDPHKPDPYKESPLSRLPLYDDKVLEEATSGLNIFVNDSSNDKKQNKNISPQKTLTGVTSAPQSSLGLHDVSSGGPTTSGLNDVRAAGSTSSTLPDVTSGYSTSSRLDDVKSDDATLSYNSNDQAASASLTDDVTTVSPLLGNADYATSAKSTTSSLPADALKVDDESISIDELFNDDDTKASAKIDRLLSDDKTTDALAKEIANLLTDDQASSSENPNASPNDIALLTDDEPFEGKHSPPVADVTTVSSEEAVSTAQKSSPLTVSGATQQCLVKRGLGSTECSLSMICCSVCCPLDSCPLKDIFKKDEIPDDCDCKRQVVCPGVPGPSPVVSYHRPPITISHAPIVTFAESPTSLAYPSGLASHAIPHVGVPPPATANLLPNLVPPSHPAVFVGPDNVQTPTLVTHPALPYHVAQPALSPLNINFHWPPHIIPHNPGFPPLFRPPIYHRPPLYTHPIYPHLPYMHPHPPFIHPHPPFIHHSPFIHHPHPIIHPHPPVFHPAPIHFHPPPHVHVPVVIHPPPQPVVIHTPPPPPPKPKPKPKPKPASPPPKPKPKPPPKKKGPPGPSYSGADATASQGNSPGAPPGIPPLVVVGTSKKSTVDEKKDKG